MAKTVVGLFDSFSEAQQVVEELLDNGFRREDISVVADEGARGAAYERERAVGGADSSAGIGAATGGLIGSLVGAGVPHERAEYYAEGIRRGGTLLTVTADDSPASMAAGIMERYNVVDIDRRGDEWRGAGWTSFDADTQPLRVGYDQDFGQHFQQTYGSSGYSYDDYHPVYNFGAHLATSDQYRGRGWEEFEAEARQTWESRNPDTWDQFKDTIRYAYEKAMGPR